MTEVTDTTTQQPNQVPPEDEASTLPNTKLSFKDKEYQRLRDLHDSYKPVWLTETIALGPWLSSDRDAIVENMNDPRIYSYINGIPYPYTLKDADDWLSRRINRMTDKGTPLEFCIRDMARGGKAIGSVGTSNESDEVLDQDDTGYWLAPAYHGHGLMSKALKLMLYKVSLIEVGKRKFNSFVFKGNWASRRTMEKIGFVTQEDLSRTIIKNGEEIQQWVLRLYVTDEDVIKWGKEITEAKPCLL
ncbi:hypothetical protein FBU30_001925 [Linnemannia zychae]|nr:hypothetical protein FBU30_001925 [Linnemannia zychae]